ncbi:MAG: DNA-3-methyladenine glycosylase [Chitinophagales bacterium]|nr:DNA-3-methyladenine glycosylase [Chitinophagales bacterium]
MKIKLPRSFYTREDVVTISRELLGKCLFTRINGLLTGGLITETETYRGPEDRASHAFGGRRTQRTEIMYATGGTAYVYLCYGIHHLFNVVTNRKDTPHAVLIRAIEPMEGIELMLKRRKKKKMERSVTAGPGSMSQALGITTVLTGVDLLGNEIWIEDRGNHLSANQIISTKRIGVDYAGEHAERLWRFTIKGNLWVSK